MESLRIALEIVLPLFLLLAVGYCIKLTGIMNETSVRQTNNMIFKVFLPLLVFFNIYKTDLTSSFDMSLLLFAVVGVLLQFIISLCLVILLEHDNARRGVMLQGMFRSNFVLFGIPISTALFGDSAAGLASILIAVIIPLYNMLAVISLESFNGKKPSLWKILVGILTNPLIIASAAGILFVVFHIPLPTVLYKTVSDLSIIATPLAFVILGASFSFGETGRCVRDLCITLGAKLVTYPLLFIALAILMGFRDAHLAVLLTVFGSPIAVSSFTMAQQMGGDDKLAGQLVVFSSLLSVFTMFLFIFGLKELAFF
ncbi:AEC family transporter [Neglecta sp. X4]|uniref:AEC family transporter n=1 Tax=unclassified Neglectibacter TaxID=2632164 RepID=UPI0013718B86|nr:MULTISPECIES: AEC family transporter [unclassified Neglectibacter]NBI16221.1 AEC family transporter [Neglectibacter sp. 59]NBJ71918.1 AEC family transporter [Neglectibacter sp. X4]NCE79695.1 AEC family transporter [Neglectibacter sp. X58]